MGNNLYIYNGLIVSEAHRAAYLNLLKVLFRLEVIDEDTVIELAVEFRVFFV